MTNPQNSRSARGQDPWKKLVALAGKETLPPSSDDLAAADDFSRRVVSHWFRENGPREARFGRATASSVGGASVWEALGLRGLAVAASLAVAALLWGFAPDATASGSENEILLLDPLSGLLTSR